MEPTSSSGKVMICQTCGSEGFRNAFIYCVNCLGCVIHRYCLHVMPMTYDEFVPWFCEDCKPAFTKNVPKVKPVIASPRTLKAIHLKKKQKKKKLITSLVERIEEEAKALDSPMEGTTKRKRKTNEHRSQDSLKNETHKARTKIDDSIGHSWSESSPTMVNLNTKKSMELHDSSSLKEELEKKQDINVSKIGSDISQSPYIATNVQDNRYPQAQPVIDPVWRGSFNILQKDYEPLEGFVAHLSTKACAKVYDEAKLLPSLLCLEMQPIPDLWPKSFQESEPSDGHIALYFFPEDTKYERAFDHLVIDMIDGGLAMKAKARNAELLIFTSKALPRLNWRFQGKYYLWGVFRGKRNDSSPVADPNSTVSNNSDRSRFSPNEVIDGKKITTRMKTLDVRSPQSPLTLSNTELVPGSSI